MRKFLAPLVCVVFAMTMQSAVAGPVEDIFEKSFMQSCLTDRMFKDLEVIFTEASLKFDSNKGCGCVARKIVGDSRVIGGLLSEGKDSNYAKLAVMAYTSQCLSSLAEDGMVQLSK